ncbi:MAG: Penicillin-binding protein, partial [Phycisphaerales bacterium]|nr:Penicillin-binding protein [Phycisphaerales bacterium]
LLAGLTFLSAVAWWPYPPGIGQPAQAATFLEDRDGVPLAALVAADGQWRIRLKDSDVSPHLLNAIVAVEDGRFYAHHGVDWKSAGMAAWEDVRGLRVRRGASTITMQLQRLREPRPRTFFNKFEQAVRAAQIEKESGKREILVEYVNRAPFGGNLVGAGAASWRYFGRPCAQLSLGEAALLAGIPQSPNRLRPDRFPQAALARRNHVLDRMLAMGMIDTRQHDEACGEPIVVAWHRLPQDRTNAAAADGALPALVRVGGDRAGTTVRTTIDAGVQHQVAQAAAEQLRRLESSGVSAAAVVVLDTQSAQCLAALSLGRDAEAVDLTRRPRSTGSALKPFIYAEAFEAGVCSPGAVLEDSPTAWAGYMPADYDREFRGSMTAAEALAQSRNIPAMLVLAKVGVEPATGTMEAAGLRTLARSPGRYGLSLAIGGAEAAPMELAQAYAMLARGGTTREVTMILPQRSDLTLTLSRRTGRGDQADCAPSSRTDTTSRCLSATACWQTLGAISGAERTADVCPEAVRFHVAWKTGTSSGHRDAWCAAVTRRHTVVVWLGNASGQGSPALVGAEAAAPLVLRLIASLGAGGPDLEPWPVVPEPAQLSSKRATDKNARPFVGGTLTLVSPVSGQQFLIDSAAPPDRQRVLLKAMLKTDRPGTGGDSRTLWWFVDNQPVGVADPAAQLWWPPTPGAHEVRVIDAQGHAATAQIVVK